MTTLRARLLESAEPARTRGPVGLGVRATRFVGVQWLRRTFDTRHRRRTGVMQAAAFALGFSIASPALVFAGPPSGAAPQVPGEETARESSRPSSAVVATTGQTPAPTVDPAADRREAGRAFRRGVDAYGANDFATAVREFEAANALVPHPDTLYNLALAVQAIGDLRRAHALFSTVERSAADPELVREARRVLLEMRESVGVVTVHTAPGSVVCVDEAIVLPHGSGLHDVALTPGEHTIAVHDVDLKLEVRAGETRTLWLDRVDAVTTRRHRRTSRALTGAAIGFATLASGLAITAVATDEGPREGFEVGAAVSGGFSVGTLIALLAHERAHANGRTKARVSAELLAQPSCAASTEPQP